jgi:hypothetical protein
VNGMAKVHDDQWNRSGAFTFYESPASFVNCSFYYSKAEDEVNMIRSEFSFTQCLFHKMSDDALDVDFSKGEVTNCAFEDCHENAIDASMSRVKVSGIYVKKAGNKALNVKGGSEFSGQGITIQESNIAISAEDQSKLQIENVTIKDSEIGLVGYKNKPGSGYPEMVVSGLKIDNVKENYLKEKKAKMTVNGVVLDEKVKDVEDIIKRDKKHK